MRIFMLDNQYYRRTLRICNIRCVSIATMVALKLRNIRLWYVVCLVVQNISTSKHQTQIFIMNDQLQMHVLV